MHRIDGPGATIDNFFTEGDPAQGIPATTVTAAWLNALQEEIANVIEETGDTLSKPDNTQLLEAILHIAGQNQGFSTGDVKLTLSATPETGWIIADDGTIGDAGSGATNRANSDTQALFTLLWNNVSDAFAPVPGGRGSDAASDWGAGKTITLTRMLGRALAVAGGGAGLSSREIGQHLGAESHVLSENEMPLHGHPYRQNTNTESGTSSGNGGALITKASGSGTNTNRAAWTGAPSDTAGRSIGGTGGNQPHNNMQPTAFLNAMIKL